MLLSVPRYNFYWQRTYQLAEPRLLPAGTVVEMSSVHDNSAQNPLNPSQPPMDVEWGESTTEEMSIGFLGYWKADENLRRKAVEGPTPTSPVE